ncbi:hypothetical protein BDN70DRAFT_873703 [Pholiota conissans]|uniref:Uncharacterized protein n=1 Tax=Pholiota conissans TaxID=109636 RepID=A0A9P5Z9K1_9AGAR|nr:hypothetical protein BDN70DRAFT_873703 [Pholiota conissans]
MYITAVAGGAASSKLMTTELVGILMQREVDVDGLQHTFMALRACVEHTAKVVCSWIAHILIPLLLHAFEISTSWTFQALFDACHFVQIHPQPFQITGWAIFFGPIIILIPCLLLLELLILAVFNFSFVSHGFLLGSVEDRFDNIKEYFMETRESIFATIEHWTAMFNTWTTNYPPLLILRLLAGAMSLFILFGIWNGW